MVTSKKTCISGPVDPAPSSLRIHLGVRHFAADGRLVRESLEEGHSWVRNGWNMMFMIMADARGAGGATPGPGSLAMRAYDGSVQYSNTMTLSRDSAVFTGDYGFVNGSTAGALSQPGIRVGSSADPFDLELANLVNPIGHGSGDGQLQYQLMVAPIVTYAASVWRCTHSRTFSNSASGSRTIREMGLFWGGKIMGNYSSPTMMAREVLLDEIALDPGESVELRYLLSMDFSVIDGE